MAMSRRHSEVRKVSGWGMGSGDKERPAAVPRSSGYGFTLSLVARVSGRD
jgi:hypothetical protein